MDNKVCAIVISYNNINECKKTITAIYHQVEHIVIVNNFSTSNVSKDLESLYSHDKKIDLIFLDENYGIAYALNRGVELALTNNYKWVITMDQDSVASSDMITKMIYCADNLNNQDQKNSCIFSTYNTPKDILKPCIEIYMGITSGNLIHTSIYKKFGLYNEEFFIDSVDFEFFLRLKNKGIKFYQAPQATMSHSLGEKKENNKFSFLTPSYTHSPLRRYYIFRNHLYLCKLYFFKNPIYLTWKTLNITKLFLSILLLEKNKLQNIGMILTGIKHFFKGTTGAHR
ncbi:glycosyltransferase family 2 protein [uncultured Cocleimonas sp.]|uniref:glycosyltransferase family 2 protein n=1 Tax=uncultured Cocleimonas sp. TaxID=1051587 RepID=UPI0026278B8C|nr:glycosyltransferase family 2 protein [uncultured Cocleimonas sp.]